MNFKRIVLRWFPALVIMVVIFLFSSQPLSNLPNFDWADNLVKKSGHVIGYSALALCYWHGLGLKKEHRWLAWLLAIIYALTDEYHQSFVAGRHAAIWDVLIFDNLGAVIGLWLANHWMKQERSTRPEADRR
jgi:VanZ family protein